MKANKIFAVALAALTLVGFNACKKENKVDGLTLNPTSMKLKVGEKGTITATVGATWTTNNEAVATVAPGNDGGKTALVTAVAEGTAIISATANGETKTCVVSVQNGGGQGGETHTITAKRIWPVVLDQTTYDANTSIVAGDLRVNPEAGNNLFIWADGETYSAGSGGGKNYFGVIGENNYISLVVAAPAGWSGFGINISNAESLTALQAVKAAVAANPDKMFLHLAIKSTNAGNHQFYLFGDAGKAATSLTLGTEVIEGGRVLGDFPRDGEWHAFDVPLAQFATAFAGITIPSNKIDVISFLSGKTVGAQLDLDAIYFYEKN